MARLADVSVTYYTFIEQGRATAPSEQVLDAIGRALRLSAVERAHLDVLIRGAQPVVALPDEVLVDGIAELVARMDPYPTYVTGRRWDVLAANRGAHALFTDFRRLPPEHRNMLRWMMLDPAAKLVYVEWAAETRAQLARFRAAAPVDGDDLVAELLAESAEARAWWDEHDVAPLGGGTKLLRHPAFGVLTLRHSVLRVADAPDQKLVTFGGVDREILERLAAFADS